MAGYIPGGRMSPKKIEQDIAQIKFRFHRYLIERVDDDHFNILENTRQAINKFYGRNLNDIDVVYHGYDKRNFRPAISYEEKEMVAMDLHKKYHLPTNFILFIGGLNWGLVGLFHFDLITGIFGDYSPIARIIYIIVGLSAIYVLVRAISCCKNHVSVP